MSLIWGEPERRPIPRSKREKLWERSRGKCEFCGKSLRYEDAHVAHKVAVAKGGTDSLRNLMIVHPSCNLKMGTKHPSRAWRGLGMSEPRQERVKHYLKTLKIAQLRYLAKRNHVSVRGRVSEDWFSVSKLGPSKRQYVTSLSGVLSVEDARTQLTRMPKPVKRKRKRQSDSWSFW